MPLSLPAHVVDLSRPTPVMRSAVPLRDADPHTLRPRERRALIALDAGQGKAVVERVVPLVDGRWAVGRRSGAIAVWRVVPAPSLEVLQHPAWLWASDDWLDPHQASTSSFATPARLPLRTLVAHAGPLHASRRHVIKALASCVRTLRAGQPTAVVVSPEALQDAANPGRAFVLALLTLMPAAWRAPLRSAVGDPAPQPGAWSLVVVDHPVDGYRLVDLDHPDDEGTDLVAYYVRERLLADDPEALEAATFQVPPDPTHTGPLGDPWAGAVAAVLRQPPDGVARVDDDAVDQDAEGAIRALCARIAAGTTLADEVGGGSLLARLVAITRSHRDPRPWQALLHRPASDRAQAVLALLADPLHPSAALIEALVDAYPAGAELGPWFDRLLGWLREGIATDAVVSAVEHTLLAWPVAQSASTRASVWSEVVRHLVSLGEDEAAMAALTSDVARRIASDGAGPALASLWGVVPQAFRSAHQLDALVRLLGAAPNAGASMVALFQHTQSHHDERQQLFRAWHAVRAGSPADAEHDALFRAVRGSPFQAEWLAGLFAARDPVHAADAVAAVATGSADPLWVAAEAAMAHAMALVPSQRFFALPALLAGIDALEPVAPLRLLDAARRPFPAPEITDVARLLLTARHPSPLWSFVAVAAAPVDRFDDEVVDAAVVDFCAMREVPEEVREVALVCAEQLGGAEGFDALDHARWMVRISLAPDGSRITPELTLSLVRGVLSRTDGLERLLAITMELLELPPEHPALLAFVHFLLPRAWEEGVPTRFREAIDPESVPVPLRSAWLHACGGRRVPPETDPC